MECINCKEVIPDGSKFCNHCGQHLGGSNGVIHCPNCDNEIPSDSKFCPFCGKPLEKSSMNLLKLVFPEFTILLGETTIQELIAISEEKGVNYEKCSQDYDDGLNFEFANGIHVYANTERSPILLVSMQNDKKSLSTLNQIIPIGNIWTIGKLVNYCKKSKLQFQISKDEKYVFVLLSDTGFVLRLDDHVANSEVGIGKLFGCPECGGKDLQLARIENAYTLMMRCKSCKHKFDMVEVWENLKYCPNCGSANFTDDGSGHVQFSCKDCGYIWGDEEDNNHDEETEDEYEEDEYEDEEDEDEEDEYEDDDDEKEEDDECPVCGSDDIEDDGSDYLQYTCSSCGHIWGHVDDVECPECGSYDVEDDGYDYLQYHCNNCGHNWGDEQ